MLYKFTLDAGTPLTADIIGKAIRYNANVNVHALNFAKGYYDGTGQQIMFRAPADIERPNNRIVKNYCATIVDNFAGYICGNPITYQAQEAGGDIGMLKDVIDYNDTDNEDLEWLRDGLIYGVAYELLYVNEQNQIRYKHLNPVGVIPIYSDDLDERLIGAITVSPVSTWQDGLTYDNLRYRVTVYTDTDITNYECDNSMTNLVQTGSEHHYFGAVPLAVFNPNSENAPIFERIISLQDAYNSLLSDEVNDFQAFVDAYMVLRNIQADEEDLEEMKRTRSIMIDGDSDVSYLTKDITNTTVESMLENINSSIHTISNSPDFSSQEFQSGVSSGTALQFKLVGFNNLASNIEMRFRKAINERLALVGNVMWLLDDEPVPVTVTFTHNLPANVADTANIVNSLRGLVSDETLLAQLPFIDDVPAELERLHNQGTQYTDDYALGALV